MAGENWAESLMTESAKAAFGVTGSIFGVIGGLITTRLPQGRACASGFVDAATPCGMSLIGKVDVPLTGWMPWGAAAALLGFLGVLTGLLVGGVGYLLMSDRK
ncbi:hypothetical protein [Terracoccus luteus]|uniref:Uncharacterized protein n=1 Tax=Terracoccus luteus TaxID=53356 RepID=A0A839PPT3_9MICO|nr:hypothetical protein [Terracoccus luteus]MBB2985013.1 hypothetical protein [Terracoccus luteus]MCP2170665.1 hypothetical protein [Terracoccus luteus]